MTITLNFKPYSFTTTPYPTRSVLTRPKALTRSSAALPEPQAPYTAKALTRRAASVNRKRSVR